MKKITMSTIAARTGVSLTTVSRVLGGNAARYRISEDTCNLVRREAQRLGYLPGFVREASRSTRSGMVGLLLPSISNPFFADIASTVISEMDSRGYTTIVIDTQESEDKLFASARGLVARQVEGMIIVPCGDDPASISHIGELVPVVMVDRYYENTPLSYVTTNNFQGGLDGTRQILARGHRKIACLQGVVDSMPNIQRVKGYRAAMEEAGLADEILIVGSDFSVRNGYLETKMLLSSPRRPSAIFAMGNTILLGVLKAVRETDLRIPEDIAVLSFDDNMYMDFFTPSIARMSQPAVDMGALATKILLSRICGETDVKSQIMLRPSFIPGGSL